MDSLPSEGREGEEREGEERERGREREGGRGIERGRERKKERERRRVSEREGGIITIQYTMVVHSTQMLYVHGTSMHALTITIKTVLGTKLVILATNSCLSLKFWDIQNVINTYTHMQYTCTAHTCMHMCAHAALKFHTILKLGIYTCMLIIQRFQ